MGRQRAANGDYKLYLRRRWFIGCAGELLRRAVLESSPIFMICLAFCAPGSLHFILLAE